MRCSSVPQSRSSCSGECRNFFRDRWQVLPSFFCKQLWSTPWLRSRYFTSWQLVILYTRTLYRECSRFMCCVILAYLDSQEKSCSQASACSGARNRNRLNCYVMSSRAQFPPHPPSYRGTIIKRICWLPNQSFPTTSWLWCSNIITIENNVWMDTHTHACVKPDGLKRKIGEKLEIGYACMCKK